MFPFAYNPYTNECFVQPQVNAPQHQQDLFCISPFGFQKTQPIIRRATIEPQNLLWKFTAGDDDTDELVLGKKVSPQQVSNFLNMFLQHQQRLKLKKQHEEMQQRQMFDPIFGPFAAALFDQAFKTNEVSSIDYEQAGEALSKKIFKNYKFSLSNNDRELVISDSNGHLVKIFELEDAYESLAVKSMFMEDNTAIIKLTLYKKKMTQDKPKKMLRKKSSTNSLKKKRSNSSHKVQKNSPVLNYPVSVNDAVRALEEFNIKQREEDQAQALKQREEREENERKAAEAERKLHQEQQAVAEAAAAAAKAKRAEEEKLAEEKRIADEATAKAEKEEAEKKKAEQEENDRKLKLKQEQEAAMLAKKEKLAKAKEEYEKQQQKLNAKQERMALQAQRLNEKKLKLQKMYEDELAKLVQEAEEAEAQNGKFTVYSPVEEESNKNNATFASDSCDDSEMNEESSCSTDEEEKIATKEEEPKLKKSKSIIVVEDVEDESDKDYRRSLLNSPNSNAVLEGV